MLTLLLLGFAASIATELVRWLDKRLMGTAAHGQGAFLLTLLVTMLVATARVAYQYIEGYPTLHEIWQVAAQIFAISQVYFHLVAKTFGLRLTPPPSSTPLL